MRSNSLPAGFEPAPEEHPFPCATSTPRERKGPGRNPAPSEEGDEKLWGGNRLPLEVSPAGHCRNHLSYIPTPVVVFNEGPAGSVCGLLQARMYAPHIRKAPRSQVRCYSWPLRVRARTTAAWSGPSADPKMIPAGSLFRSAPDLWEPQWLRGSQNKSTSLLTICEGAGPARLAPNDTES